VGRRATTTSDNTVAATVNPKFSKGQRVRVHSEQSMARWRKPHLRVPGYIFGVSGIVESYEGSYPDPSYKAFRSMILKHKGDTSGTASEVNQEQDEEERKEHPYRVRFLQEDLWPEGKGLSSNAHSYDHDNNVTVDTVALEGYENWLEDHTTNPVAEESVQWEMDPTSALQESNSSQESNYHHHHDHHHHNHDDQEHLPWVDLEQKAVNLELASQLCSSGSVGSDVQPTDVVGDRLGPALIALLSQPERLWSGLRMDSRKIIDARCHGKP